MAYNDSLLLSISIETGKAGKSILLSEFTGLYNGTSNTQGWDNNSLLSGQPSTADVQATLTITLPDTSEYSFDTVLTSAGFPTVDHTIEYEIPNTSLGLSASQKLPSGVWEFEYLVEGAETDGDETGWSESITRRFLIAVKEQCGVDKLGASITDCDLNCSSSSSSKLKRYIEAQTMLNLAYKAADCSKTNLALLLLEKVNWILNEQNCNC